MQGQKKKSKVKTIFDDKRYIDLLLIDYSELGKTVFINIFSVGTSILS